MHRDIQSLLKVTLAKMQCSKFESYFNSLIASLASTTFALFNKTHNCRLLSMLVETKSQALETATNSLS
jgi:hypothetical protein